MTRHEAVAALQEFVERPVAHDGACGWAPDDLAGLRFCPQHRQAFDQRRAAARAALAVLQAAVEASPI